MLIKQPDGRYTTYHHEILACHETLTTVAKQSAEAAAWRSAFQIIQEALALERRRKPCAQFAITWNDVKASIPLSGLRSQPRVDLQYVIDGIWILYRRGHLNGVVYQHHSRWFAEDVSNSQASFSSFDAALNSLISNEERKALNT